MMKRFLSHTTLFAVIIVLLLASGEAAVRQTDNPYKLKNSYMERNARSVTTLILGHSQTYYGIAPACLPDTAFNLAMVSQTPSVDRALLEKYAPQLKSLRRVIMPVTYTSLLEDDFEKRDEWWRLISYELYMNLGRHSRFSRYGAEICDISGYAGKLATVFGLRKAYFAPDSLGQGTEYALRNKLPDWRDTGIETALLHTGALKTANIDINTREISKIDSICRQLGAQLIIITPPVYKEYRDNIDSTLWRMTEERIRAITAGGNAIWLDYSDDCRFGDDDFFDADHLTSDVGAVRLTQILSHDLTDRPSAK